MCVCVIMYDIVCDCDNDIVVINVQKKAQDRQNEDNIIIMASDILIRCCQCHDEPSSTTVAIVGALASVLASVLASLGDA